jgi:lysophospholipase L1-like esterase
MVECAVLGDSIAVGVARLRNTCQVQAVVGITSDVYVSRFRNGVHAGQVLISLGSNDSSDPKSEAAMRLLRSRINADQVTWLLSANNQRTADIARKIAREHMDRVIDSRPFIGQDGVHPTASGYFRLAAMWRTQQ